MCEVLTIEGIESSRTGSGKTRGSRKESVSGKLGYILGEAGMVMPRIPGQTVSGGDDRQYFFRVRDLIRLLEQRRGKAERVEYPPSNGGSLAGRQGVILFEVSGWSDAQGHATLFNGRTCYDHCYFNEPGARYRTDRANFWSLS
ncbi:hypothetical protein BCO18175_00513 [Burkholderia contaminans]|uniref:T6SS effector amidase Tae4 family protein n=1 Tax=Burkholderia contaminans TaxID=488447 RepID=UPI001453BB4D|nr:T6SS effector amidase Tae4 family protein [Burkholderia contaminans]VWC57287.1 hypothetical protein BCO18175_00513 [Burkholderia contaminans]